MNAAEPQIRSALCLSGGGFRALHWHLGGLQALNETGALAGLHSISGVSAGAIAAAWLGLHWAGLEFDRAGRAVQLEALVLTPLRRFMQQRIGILPALLSGLPFPGLPSRLLSAEFDRQLFHGATLSDMAAAPDILISAVDLATAELAVLQQGGVRHGLHGSLPLPALSLAQAVAASCAFPPFFAPALLDLPQAGRHDDSWAGPSRLQLADAVLIDNLGLASVWDSHDLLLLSDASLPRKHPTPLAPSWHSVLLHAQRSQFHHARLTRLMQLREQVAQGRRRAAHWGLDSDSAPELQELQRIAANLLRLPPALQESLERQSYRLARLALDTAGSFG